MLKLGPELADPTTMNRLLPLPLLAVSLLLAGCGGGDDLAVPVETMIEFEAAWQCDVTRYSFADAEAIEAKQDEVRTSYGVAPADHQTFTTMLAGDAELRESVANRIDSRCPTATEEVVDQ